jgi:formate hydrogenlyase subunit 3/multisubunit Na+/H+ antiporter MnhD subunit
VGAPLLIFVLSSIAILIQTLLRRRHFLASLITGVFAFLIAGLILSLPLDDVLTVLGSSFRIERSWTVMGRSFSLGDDNRAVIAYLYVAGGFILMGAWTTQASRMFYPLAMAIMALVSASMMINPFLFSAILLELAAIAALLMLSTREKGRALGGLRLLIQYTLAMLAILLAGSRIDITIPSGFVFSSQVLILLGFGFAVLLSIPPFHSWLPISSTETHPFAIAFIAIILQASGLFFILRFIAIFSFDEIGLSFFKLLRIGGLSVSIICALWAMVQNRLAKLGSYLLVADMGLILFAIGLGSVLGFTLALSMLAVRVIGVFGWAFGLSILQARNRKNSHRNSRNTNFEFPKLLVFLGLFSIVGMPLTAGFPARWELLITARSNDDGYWIALVIILAMMAFGIIRNARIVLQEPMGSTLQNIGRLERIFLTAGVVFTLGLGFFPTILQRWVSMAVTGLGLLGP